MLESQQKDLIGQIEKWAPIAKAAKLTGDPARYINLFVSKIRSLDQALLPQKAETMNPLFIDPRISFALLLNLLRVSQLSF